MFGTKGNPSASVEVEHTFLPLKGQDVGEARARECHKKKALTV